jgi:hypothetical protein
MSCVVFTQMTPTYLKYVGTSFKLQLGLKAYVAKGTIHVNF